MNVADSQRLASELEKLGLSAAPTSEAADVIVINTCVVRQSPEDKAVARLLSLKPIKKARPDVVFGVMGCMVGIRGANGLRERFPFVDVFLPPSDPSPIVELLKARGMRPDPSDADYWLDQQETEHRFSLQEADFVLPAGERGRLVSAHVPIIFGCNHVCTFCIIPYRRGKERSRPIADILSHVRSLASQGVKEITLLGQIVDRYGYDLPDCLRLPDVLRLVGEVEGLERIRFLTSHPAYMNEKLLDAVAELPKVCRHIEVPVQAGDDRVLARMRRGYSAEDYRKLVGNIRTRIPGVSIATDIIVGFPGETEEEFNRTYSLLAELKLDVAHVAMYSPRPRTSAASHLPDDVPGEEKERRRRAIEDLQAEIVGKINRDFLWRKVQVLVEEKHKGKWKGRTQNNKLVFFEDEERDWSGHLADVTITWTGPWSMTGAVEREGDTKAADSPRLFAN